MLETVYEHIKGSDTFTVTAAERWSIGMIRRLKEKYPDQVDIRYINQDGSVLAHLPIEWMRIVPKKRDTLTKEQRQANYERMRAVQGAFSKAGHGENEAIFEDSMPEVSEDSPEYRQQERGEYIPCE